MSPPNFIKHEYQGQYMHSMFTHLNEYYETLTAYDYTIRSCISKRSLIKDFCHKFTQNYFMTFSLALDPS